MLSTFTPEQRKQALDGVKAEYKRLRDEARAFKAELEQQREANKDLQDNYEKYNDAIARNSDLCRKTLKELKKILKEEHEMNLDSRNFVSELRQHTGKSGRAKKQDWIDFIVHKEFPHIGWLAIANKFSQKDPPPGWKTERRDGSHLTRPYTSYTGAAYPGPQCCIMPPSHADVP